MSWSVTQYNYGTTAVRTGFVNGKNVIVPQKIVSIIVPMTECYIYKLHQKYCGIVVVLPLIFFVRDSNMEFLCTLH